MSDWTELQMQALSQAVIAAVDEDLAAPIRGLEWERRVIDRELLAIQQIRLLRQLLEQLRDGCNRSEARSNG
jgi:hypothetical protein